jgi:hypothetical protein
MNRLASRTDDNTDQYNANVVPEFDRLIVPYKNYQYKRPEFISQDFVKTTDIERLLKKKFQGNSLVKKTDADIQEILAKTTNLINKIPNPQAGVNSLINLPANDAIFNGIVNTTNQQTAMEMEQTNQENAQIDSLLNNSSSTSSSGSNLNFDNNNINIRARIQNRNKFDSG